MFINKINQYLPSISLIVLFSLFSTACSILSRDTSVDEIINELVITPSDSPETPTEEQAPDDSDSSRDNGEVVPSADRQPIEITTSDGRNLEAYFYPPKEENSPIIVLMHWSPGTLEDWNQIALWLQNRQEETTSRSDGLHALVSYSSRQNDPWQDPSWFPTLPPEVSFGVLTFNFGGRGNSQEGAGGEGLFLDALAAVIHASTFDGIDPHKISTMGASIGADASLNSCQALNKSSDVEATCVGAFSLSPGSYLGRDYGESADLLRQSSSTATVYCLAASNDGNSLDTCLSAMGTNFVPTAYDGSAHGMNLINPSYSPNPLFKLLEFFEKVYSMELIN